MIRTIRPHELFALVPTTSYADRLVPFVLPDGHTPKLLESAVLCALSCWSRPFPMAWPPVVLEFGTGRGIQTLQLATWNPEAEIVTIDLGDPEDAAEPDRLIARNLARLPKAFGGTEQARRITQLRGNSLTLDLESYRWRTKLVYVDGGHSTALVASDSAWALRVCAARGVVVWHDYGNPAFPNVTDFLDRMARGSIVLYHVAETSMVVFLRGAEL